MLATLEEQDAAIILFDFTAAFPSVSRKYIMEMACAAGFPPAAMGVLASLYHNTFGILLLHGRLCENVALEAGLRQGCP
eukprot:2287323-Pyramimonas_sp.AAC.1